jgi:hypothetical protein
MPKETNHWIEFVKTLDLKWYAKNLPVQLCCICIKDNHVLWFATATTFKEAERLTLEHKTTHQGYRYTYAYTSVGELRSAYEQERLSLGQIFPEY